LIGNEFSTVLNYLTLFVERFDSKLNNTLTKVVEVITNKLKIFEAQYYDKIIQSTGNQPQEQAPNTEVEVLIFNPSDVFTNIDSAVHNLKIKLPSKRKRSVIDPVSNPKEYIETPPHSDYIGIEKDSITQVYDGDIEQNRKKKRSTISANGRSQSHLFKALTFSSKDVSKQ
jgi:hypothetical protein